MKNLQKQIISLLKEYNNNFGLLNESKKEILMDKLGLKKELAEVFDEVGKKLSVWLANKFLKYYYELGMSMAEPNVPKKDILDWARHQINQDHGASNMRMFLSSIMDYIVVGLNRDKSSLEDLPMFKIKQGEPNIYDKSKEWHEQLNVGSGKFNYIEKNPIIIDFRDENGNGYYWADLETNNSKEECERMGHCGRSSSGSLYSLRSYKLTPDGKYKVNNSHLTASIGNDGIMYQLKGPKNSKPKGEYHQYILPLFNLEDENGDYLIQGFGKEYASQQDFKLEDLPIETLKELYEIRPDIFKSRGLKNKMAELGIEIEVEPLESYFDFHVDFEYIRHYIKNDEVIAYIEQSGSYNSWEQEIFLSQAVLQGNHVDELYQWIDENFSQPEYEEPHLEKILKENVYRGLQSHIIRLLKMMNPTEEELKQLEELEKITEYSLYIQKLAFLIREIDYDNLIIDAIYEVYRDSYRENNYGDIIDKLHNSLMDALGEYGEVSVNKWGINLSGDLTNLVDMDDPRVIKVYEDYENNNDGEIYMDGIISSLLDNRILTMPRWERDNFEIKYEINNDSFNNQLNGNLNYIERTLS